MHIGPCFPPTAPSAGDEQLPRLALRRDDAGDRPEPAPSRAMRVLLVTGIWPPDVGGPATHMPEVADFLHSQGHEVSVLTTASSPPDDRPYPIEWVSRSLPPGIRHLAVATRVTRLARQADVVYATSVPTRAAIGTVLARRPLVLKLTTDDGFERSVRLGWFSGDMDEFQQATGTRLTALCALRNSAVRRARVVVCPSTYLAELAEVWGAAPGAIVVIPNAGPRIEHLPHKAEARRALATDGAVLVFAGRLGPQKALHVALEALAPASGVTLLVVGDGPERAALEAQATRLGLGSSVRFLGAQPHERVLELLRAADASLLSSDWENLPHGVVESLTVGTPVIATAVGGVPELVEHEVNGLLVAPRDPPALTGAILRLANDPVLLARLTANAACSVATFAPDRVFGRLAAILEVTMQSVA